MSATVTFSCDVHPLFPHLSITKAVLLIQIWNFWKLYWSTSLWSLLCIMKLEEIEKTDLIVLNWFSSSLSLAKHQVKERNISVDEIWHMSRKSNASFFPRSLKTSLISKLISYSLLIQCFWISFPCDFFITSFIFAAWVSPGNHQNLLYLYLPDFIYFYRYVMPGCLLGLGSSSAIFCVHMVSLIAFNRWPMGCYPKNQQHEKGSAVLVRLSGEVRHLICRDASVNLVCHLLPSKVFQ